MKVTSHSELETSDAGRDLALDLHAGDVVLLTGMIAGWLGQLLDAE